MRNIGEVIDKMMEKVPESEEELRSQMIRVKRAAGYTPPEMSTGPWNELASVCQRYLGEPPYEVGSWKEGVLKAFNGVEGA